MRQRLVTFATIVSTLLFAGFCFLWIRSHFLRDYAFAFFPWPGQNHLKFDADSRAGQIELSWQVWSDAHREAVRQRNDLAGQNFYHRTFVEFNAGYSRSIPPTWWNAIGFHYYSVFTHRSFCFPHYFAAIVAGAFPAFVTIKRVRESRRLKAGLCPSCGYDLRATPDRCPECGFTSDQRAMVTRS